MMETRRWTDLYEFFQFAKVNPGMVVSDESLLQLELICRGYQVALSAHVISESGTDFNYCFGNYLQARFGWSSCQGWARAIQRHCRGKDRGWKRFFTEKKA